MKITSALTPAWLIVSSYQPVEVPADTKFWSSWHWAIKGDIGR